MLASIIHRESGSGSCAAATFSPRTSNLARELVDLLKSPPDGRRRTHVAQIHQARRRAMIVFGRELHQIRRLIQRERIEKRELCLCAHCANIFATDDLEGPRAGRQAGRQSAICARCRRSRKGLVPNAPFRSIQRRHSPTARQRQRSSAAPARAVRA